MPPKKKKAKRSYVVVIERTQVIRASSPEEAKRLYMEGIVPENCVSVYEKIPGY